MDDPIKIIYKFKNNNRRTQYHIYIFVGEIPSATMKILDKIKNLSLYDTLVTLSQSDYKKLVSDYGEFWYKKFFNTFHINNTFYQIKKNDKQKQEITKIYGKEWMHTHIEDFKLMDKKIFYSYEALIKNEKLRKEMRRKRMKITEEEVQEDFTTVKKDDVDTLYKKLELKRQSPAGQILKELDGGDLNRWLDKNSEHIETVSNMDANNQVGGDDDIGFDYSDNDGDDADDSMTDFDEGLPSDELLLDEEMEMDDIENIYQETDVVPDDNLLQTTNLIKKAFKDDDIFEKKQAGFVEFDVSKDNLMYDEQLKNVFTKYYVTSQYIFKDDTVKVIKNKICCSIKNNKKFEKDAYLTPSRQYLWCEYVYNENIEKVMIGQKWIKRTDILQIDVEPNSNLRYYEELRGTLKFLRDSIKRYGSKIKREDDDFNILYDYEDYFMNNEIYMVDIYNELGKGYNPDPETLRNVTDVFIRVYFSRIKTDDIKYIIDYLNDDPKVEANKNSTIYETINNDLIIENEIMYQVEQIKKIKDYKKLFNTNYITQSVIHVNIRIQTGYKLDLFRIFNEFLVTKNYPFIQYQTADGQIIFKYSEEDIQDFSKNKENIDVLSKWFENAPYGISFKVRITEKDKEKFMAINLTENGRIEYKTQWKEEDMATVEDIKKTYGYIKALVTKINSEKNKVKFDLPQDEEFKYAFINSIQKFELPEKYIINHNDLSEFARFFYPYIALVIEPRKRISKIQKDVEKSKFGTYLRYKRVSKYENQTRIEQRVLYFMRNYDYSDQSLANEISKQFNITIERAMEEIDRVRNKYPTIKKSRKILKKLENIPKYKPPGIGVDIQGRQRDRYKIRVSGARNQNQLDRIITFMNILLYLYTETYLYKKPERQILKEKLKKLTHIARRRNKVDEVVNYEKEIKTVKQMAQLDKKRIGFKPEKGQSQWTRACQNSGTDKKRRPQQLTNIDTLISQGFKINPKTGIYEKPFSTKEGKKKVSVLLRAVGLKSTDEDGNEGPTIFYTCNPQENGDHMFVGFLSRSNNPYGQCMPCCFKKDPYTSKNKTKRDYFLKCIGRIEKAPKKDGLTVIGDQLYILQDTNKIQEGRLGFLPKYMDIYFNQILKKSHRIKHHYLLTSKTGYYFKFGTRQDEFPFLNAVGACIDIGPSQIKEKLIEKLQKDKSEILFTALNNGDIRTQFQTKERFIDFIESSNQLDFDLMNHILSIPSVILPNGMNIVVFERKTVIIRETLEKEKLRDDFSIMCQNLEETRNLDDPTKDTILILKENKNFYPIVMVKKDTETSKTVDIAKMFRYDASDEDNIITHIRDFYHRNCEANSITDVRQKKTNITAKDMYNFLMKLKKPEFNPRYQVVDSRNRCKYIVTANSTIIPTRPSGSIFNLQIIKSFDGRLLSIQETYDNLNKLYEIANGTIPIKPVGVYYSNKTKTSLTVAAIFTETVDSVPVKAESISLDWIKKLNLKVDHKQLYDKIDEEISRGKENFVVDERLLTVNEKAYQLESYELFRLELSDYLNLPENDSLKKKIERLIEDRKIPKSDKKKIIRKQMYRLIDKNLLNIYESKIDQKGGKYEKLAHIVINEPNLTNYEVQNNRDVCRIHTNKDECDASYHCKYYHDSCYLSLTKEMAIKFVNKVSEELASNSLKAAEILQKGDYFVSDIVDYSRYTQRDKQKIIRSTNVAIGKTLNDLFGKENIPKIGRRRALKQQVTDYQELVSINPIKNMGNFFVQRIIDNNLSLYRAYSNGYSWIKHKYYDLESRNLGYYSILQTDLSNYFRSIVIEWLDDKNNRDEVIKNIVSRSDIEPDIDPIKQILRSVTKDISTTDGFTEYYVLSRMYAIPIVVTNDNNEILYIFDNGLLFDRFTQNIKLLEDSKLLKYKNHNDLRNIINVRFSLLSGSTTPIDIEVIYYP
jgi:hypothetical protein